MIDAGSGLNHTEMVSDAEGNRPSARVRTASPPASRGARHRIEGIVAEEHYSDTGRIRIYIPTLIENSARSRLHRELNT